MKERAITRRDFVAKSVAAVVVGGGGLGLLAWLEHAEGATPPRGTEFVRLQGYTGYTSAILRPPGAIAERSFVAACIHCAQCGQACPVGAVRFLGVAWGRSFGTPVVVPGIRACDGCVRRDRMECIAVCPTGALADVALDDVEIGKAKVNEETCFEHKDQRVCSICHKVCPVRETEPIALDPNSPAARYSAFRTSRVRVHRAIEKDTDDKPTVNEDRCIGCGRCEEKCPQPEKAIRVEAKREILV